MRITAIELFHLSIPLCKPLPGPAGSWRALETVLVRIETGHGAGWGEASPGNAPLHSAEWAAGVFGCLRDWLAPAVLASDINSGEDLTALVDRFPGNRYAKAALDMAFWDFKARREGRPLHALLGGARTQVDVGLTFDKSESPEEFLDSLRASFESGYARVKLKIRPGWDIHMLEMVRRELPVEPISIDYEGALALSQWDLLHRIDDFGVEWVEQPLWPDELVGHAMVQESMRTPVCLDEGIASPSQADAALDLKSCQYINLKPGRLGGLTAAVEVDQSAARLGVPCYVGAMPATALASRFGFALAARPNCGAPADYFPSNEYLEYDVGPRLVPSRSGGSGGLQQVALWTEAGVGFEPDRNVIERCCTNQVRLA